MSTPDEFKTVLYEAAEKKMHWTDSVLLPQLLENYRIYHTLIQNIISMLEKKKLIVPDPYKHDKKITDIAIPSQDDFTENEAANIFGTRFSEYESMLEFLCNYMQFTLEGLTLARIKTLFQLNAYISWSTLFNTTNEKNTRVLSEMLLSVKNGTDTLSTGLLNNMISQAVKIIDCINDDLKTVLDIQKALYKVAVRKNILDNSAFTKKEHNSSDAFDEIKKLFPSLMKRQKFYTDLIQEVVQEEFGSSKERLRKTLLSKFSVEEKQHEEKVNTVDTRELLFKTVRSFSELSAYFDIIVQKLNENHNLLNNVQRSAWDRFVLALRSAFGLSGKTVEYKIKITDSYTQTEKYETIDYDKFISGIMQRSKLFTLLNAKTNPVCQKLEKESNDDVLEFVQKKVSECQSLYITLTGLDAFFKSEVAPADRLKVKGLIMELDGIKNAVIKINKRKAEYVSAADMEEQMRKLESRK
ncbi:MAG: hypothetical protein R3Y36_02950 [Spirochaetales bacterium]